MRGKAEINKVGIVLAGPLQSPTAQAKTHSPFPIPNFLPFLGRVNLI